MNHNRDACLGFAACVALAATGLSGSVAHAQTEKAQTEKAPRPDTTDVAKPGASPSTLVVLFGRGSSKIREEDKAILDRASRAYNDGKPLLMMLVGSTDLTGRAQANLTLSLRRAHAVLRGLIDRGIPAERFQLVAKGQTEPAVPTKEGVAEERNRRVVISWR